MLYIPIDIIQKYVSHKSYKFGDNKGFVLFLHQHYPGITHNTHRYQYLIADLIGFLKLDPDVVCPLLNIT